MQKIKHILVSLILLFGFCISVLPVNGKVLDLDKQDGKVLDFDKQVGISETKVHFGTNTTDVRTVIARGIKTVLGLLGIIFLIMLIIAGFRYMTASGDDEKVKTALSQIRQAVIGLIIIILSYAVTKFVFDAITKAK